MSEASRVKADLWDGEEDGSLLLSATGQLYRLCRMYNDASQGRQRGGVRHKVFLMEIVRRRVMGDAEAKDAPDGMECLDVSNQ